MLGRAGVMPASEHVVARMIQRYGFVVDIALRTNDLALLARTYHNTAALPNTQTQSQLLTTDGFVLDGNLFNGNDSLQICFREGRPHILKVISDIEYARCADWQRACPAPSRSIVPFRLSAAFGKHFCFMP